MPDENTLRSWRVQSPGELRSEHAREVVVREEKLVEGYDERLTVLEEQIDALKSLGGAFDGIVSRVKELEQRPIVEAPGNDAIAVPAAFGCLVEQVGDLRDQIEDLKNSDATLAEVVGDVGNAALMQVGALIKRADALEARVSNLPSDLLTEVERVQFEMKNRRA